MPEVACQDLVKRFRGRAVLQGVDLLVPPGSALALMGPNGAGKSTLLRILATTLVADAGWATVGGYDLSRETPKARALIGASFADDRSWYLRLSGLRNLEFFAALHGLSRSTARIRIDQLAEQVGLHGAVEAPVSDYSSGMRARLGLARALLSDPRILLLDEPTRSIDLVGAADFRRLLQDLQAGGMTVVLTTHDPVEAVEVADQAVVLKDGRVVERHGSGFSAESLVQALERA